jgi:hypothetical protein
MPGIAATTTVTKEVVLAPTLRRKLLLKLQTYASKKAQLDALQAEMDKLKADVTELQNVAGEQSLTLAGFTVTLVAPVRCVFDEKEFVKNGGDLDVYNNSMVNKPSKPYTKITVPGADHD